MVLWGQSAGAGQTGQQSFAYLDDSIVTGYIQDSGASYGAFSAYTDSTHQNFTFLAYRFGCTGSDANLTACLREVPQSDIESFIQYWVDVDASPALDFQSQPNKVTSFYNSTQTYLYGHFNKLPKILSHMQMDGASLVALPPYPYTTSPNATAELATGARPGSSFAAAWDSDRCSVFSPTFSRIVSISCIKGSASGARACSSALWFSAARTDHKNVLVLSAFVAFSRVVRISDLARVRGLARALDLVPDPVQTLALVRALNHVHDPVLVRTPLVLAVILVQTPTLVQTLAVVRSPALVHSPALVQA
jgi:hypothetical protein